MRTAKPPVQSDFIRTAELAQRLGYGTTRELWRKVVQGVVPLPHSQQGERTHLWRRDHYEFFKEHGRWPRECRFQPPL